MHSYKMKKRINSIIIIGVLTFVTICLFFPYYYMIISSFKNNTEIAAHPFVMTFPLRFENYTSSLGMILSYFKNSFIITGLSVLITSLVAIPTAYIFARYEFFGKEVLYMMILAFLMIPGIFTLIPKYSLVSKMGIMGTYWVAVLPFVAVAQITFIVYLRPYIEQLPQDLFDAAKMDGAGALRTFCSVAAPLLKPTIASQVLMCFLNSWNDFVWPMLTLSSNRELKTITLGLYSYRDVQQIQYGPMYAGFLMASIPLIILFTFNMKNFIRGITAGAVKS